MKNGDNSASRSLGLFSWAFLVGLGTRIDLWALRDPLTRVTTGFNGLIRGRSTRTGEGEDRVSSGRRKEHSIRWKPMFDGGREELSDVILGGEKMI